MLSYWSWHSSTMLMALIIIISYKLVNKTNLMVSTKPQKLSVPALVYKILPNWETDAVLKYVYFILLTLVTIVTYFKYLLIYRGNPMYIHTLSLFCKGTLRSS